LPLNGYHLVRRPWNEDTPENNQLYSARRELSPGDLRENEPGAWRGLLPALFCRAEEGDCTMRDWIEVKPSSFETGYTGLSPNGAANHQVGLIRLVV
jgi:hypothetical protein